MIVSEVEVEALILQNYLRIKISVFSLYVFLFKIQLFRLSRGWLYFNVQWNCHLTHYSACFTKWIDFYLGVKVLLPLAMSDAA